MCRSEPLLATRVWRSSGSVAIWCTGWAVREPALLNRLARHFLDRRDAFHYLLQSAPAERDHAFVDRLPAQLQGRGAHQDQLAQFVGDFHDFVETDAPLVAGVVAALAAGALLGDDLGRFFRREAG